MPIYSTTKKYYGTPERKAVEAMEPVPSPQGAHIPNLILRAIHALAPQTYRTASRALGGDYKKAGLDINKAILADLLPDEPEMAPLDFMPGGTAIAGIEMRAGKMAGKELFKKFPKEHQDIIEAVLSKEPAYIPFRTYESGLAPLVFVNPPSKGQASVVANLFQPSPEDYLLPAQGYLQRAGSEPLVSVAHGADRSTLVHENVHDKVARLLEWIGSPSVRNKIETGLINKTGIQAPSVYLKKALETADEMFPVFKKNYNIPDIAPKWRTGDEMVAYGEKLFSPDLRHMLSRYELTRGFKDAESEKAIDYLTKSEYASLLMALRQQAEQSIPKNAKSDVLAPTQAGLWGWPKDFPKERRLWMFPEGKPLMEERTIPKRWMEYGLD